MTALRQRVEELLHAEAQIRAGGGPAGHQRQRRLGRLPVRERLQLLLDPAAPTFELGLWAAHGMYPDWGDVPAAGVVTVIGRIHGRDCLVIANDATVKAGAMFPQSIKKVLRAQRIASQFRLPIIYLVDSAGVFLPLQDEVFPDEDDFGRIFRNNAVLSAAGIPQYAAVMGHCVAGGAYLPVLCDTLLMTEGSELYLAGPALVKAAIGQQTDPEELGGAHMHATLSGTVDFHEPNDETCLARLRSLIDFLPQRAAGFNPAAHPAPARNPDDLYNIVPADGHGEYDVHDVIDCLIDAGSLQEYKADFGRMLVCAYARIEGRPVGIVANQKQAGRSPRGEFQIGGVLYPDSVEKAARFVMDCNQSGVPLLFLQDVQGFMVGKAAEQSGIIRAGAKLVNVVSNSVVPKFTVIIGGTFGAGNYALCGKAYDPWLILAWPNARYAVMGPQQAADTLLQLRLRDAQRTGQPLGEEDIASLRDRIRQQYEAEMNIRHGAARGWIDAIIAPHETRAWIAAALRMVPPDRDHQPFRTGILQV